MNLTAPNPVRNAEFTKTLAGVLGRPSFLPIPSFGPKLLLGVRAGRQPALRGPAGVAHRAPAAGYQFRHPTLEVALRAVLGKPAA